MEGGEGDSFALRISIELSWEFGSNSNLWSSRHESICTNLVHGDTSNNCMHVFFYNATNCWNGLPVDLRLASTPTTFCFSCLLKPKLIHLIFFFNFIV